MELLHNKNRRVVSNVIDIFPISNYVNEGDWQMEAFRSDADLIDIAFDYPIPTVEFFGVDYVGLGYCIWDLIHLIYYNIKGPEKVQRNLAKLKSVVRALNLPRKNLNCFLMRNFVNECDVEFKGICTFVGGLNMNAEQVVNYGIHKNLFPKGQGARLKYIVDNLGLDYLCHYVQRYQDRIFIKV